MLKTFNGGIHPPYHKDLTRSKPIEVPDLPKRVVMLMGQHIGAPAEPIVKAREMVKKGQKVGEAKSYVSAHVHASVSGKVVAVEPRPHPGGGVGMAVVIESDGKDEVFEGISSPKPLSDLTPEEIKNLIRESGITGLGGAGFPTQVKISPPAGKVIDTILVNAAECEPHISADHRLMLEHPEDIVLGLEALMKATGVKKAIIGIEDNKPDAIDTMKKVTEDSLSINVQVLETKYPQGGEKQLINAITGREVPSGGLPADIGVIVNNASTCAAIAQVLKTGMPLIERITTVSGSGIQEPKNLRIRVGTPLEDIIRWCGGFKGSPKKVLMGGPMMGLTQSTLVAPAIKGTSGLLIIDESDVNYLEPSNCIRCSRCIDACPIHLLPTTLGKLAERQRWADAEEFNAMDCIECGCCSYVCPSHIPLTQLIRVCKNHIVASRQK